MNCYLYAGAWSGAKRIANGIQAFDYDTDAKTLTYKGTYGEYQSMSVVLIDEDLLFACIESKKEDLVVTYRITADGALEPLDAVHTGGLSIADLTLDTENKYLFTCNFMSCSVSMIRYDENGKMTLTDCFQVTDPGSFACGYSTVERQDKAFTHCVRMMPDGKHLCLCDVGNDKIYVLKIDAEQGKMVLLEDHTVTIDPGEGARQVVFSKDGRFAYVNTEMGNTVYVLSVGEDSSLKILQKVETLKPGIENPPKGWTSTIVMSRNGRFLYVGNRGQNNIVGYSIGEDGLLTNIGFFDCYGDSPRGLAFGADDQVLFVSCNLSGTIAMIVYHEESGRLGECLQLVENVPGSASVAWCPV